MAYRDAEPLAAGRPVHPPRLGWDGTTLLFGCGGLLLSLVVHGLVPAAGAATGVEPVLLWFLFAGSVFLLPLLVTAVWMLRREGESVRAELRRERLRFRPMTAADWLWTAGALAAIGLLSAGSLVALRAVRGESRLFFVAMEPLAPAGTGSWPRGCRSSS